MKKQINIGTSGWSYEHWKKIFYPDEIKSKDWLGYYSDSFLTVEVNTTFYHVPRETTVKNWYKVVSKNFIFSIKINRYITHRKKLKDCKESLEIFYKSIQKLKNKIGPILIQLPPSFSINPERLQDFIGYLNKKYLYTIEFRHDSWFEDEIYNILKKNNIALCITDLNGKQTPELITADFTYIRLHGPHRAYKGSYGLAKLKKWKAKFEDWSKTISIYCYFDNDEKAYAIKDALSLKKLLSMEKKS
jgi:uncharacterized protein YecE (DUF72 family)